MVTRPGILITGGSGLLACNWAQIIKSEYKVTLGVHQRKINIQGVDTLPLSLATKESVQHAIRQADASIVIHCAGLTSVESCEAAPSAARYANVDIAHNVAKACSANGVRLLHISTDHLFSGDNSMMDETAQISPVNVYGKTKAEAEFAVMNACPTAIVARTNFYCWGLPYRKSFSDSIIGTLRNNQEIGLFNDAYFTPIISSALIKASHELLNMKATGIFHLAGGTRLSKYDFGLLIAKEFNLNPELIKPIRLAQRKDLVRRPLDLSLSNLKTCDLLGYQIGDVENQLQILKLQEANSPLFD